MKTLNKYDCDNICNLLETLSVKAKELGVNVYQEAHGLKGSLVSDEYFTEAEIREMSENWVQVEDDPNIIDAEVDESIELLGKKNTFYNSMIDDEDDPEKIMMINQNSLLPSILDADISVDDLSNYCEGLKVPTETRFFLYPFAQQIQSHRLSIPKTSPTIDSLCGSKPKPK